MAKKGHTNPVGANFLNKIGLAQLPTLYGAMLAGIDVVLIGAGFPTDIPEIITAFVSGSVGKMSIPIGDKKYDITFDSKRFLKTGLSRPVFLGIVGNHLGARGLPRTDGYIFEGPLAGGHNTPQRSKALNDIGEPLYGLKDDMNFELLATQLRLNGGNQPYWLAGNYATRLAEALSCGASGVQVGTPFAFCKESMITPELKRQALIHILDGAKVYTSARASPTGFPFKELPVPRTVALRDVYEERIRVCDLGYLVEIYEDLAAKLMTRCPAGPVNTYVQKGGDLEDAEGRKCLCNCLTSTIGLGMPGEKPLITSGANLTAVKDLVAKHGMDYSAKNVIDYILEKS
ncbi:MAG: nitronate monooxygenase [archaeon]